MINGDGETIHFVDTECRWHKKAYGYHDTECGKSYTFSKDDPNDDISYCPYCSRKILVVTI